MIQEIGIEPAEPDFSRQNFVAGAGINRIEEQRHPLNGNGELLVTQSSEDMLFYTQSTYFQYKNLNDNCIVANSAGTSNPFGKNDFNDNPKDSETEMGDIASTIEDNSDLAAGDAGDVLPDEPYQYLQGLNSDNLMQFSQQSQLQEMLLKEQLDNKPQDNTLPTLTEHDYGGYNFELLLEEKRKSNCVYSETLHKIYLRMNKIFNIDVVFKPKFPIQQLRLRAFLCFVKEVSEPVLRCQNHISKDDAQNEKMRHSVLRCENPSAEYCGTADGKSINERFSVVIPLTMNSPQDDKTIKQTIAFQFTCQNSCIGRKETNLVFLLEGMNGEILGQRVLDIKICSCPKRDKSIDERNNTCVSKRKMSDDACPIDYKIRKMQQSVLVPDEVSRSSNESDSDSPTTPAFEKTASGGYRLVYDCIDKEHLLHILDAGYRYTGIKLLEEPHHAPFLLDVVQKGRTLLKRAKNAE